ncbi:dynamin family protein [Frigoriflavimonas asaccharolytica]|uniref:Dynamin N-terminal domain-containing protein n=1 Tax=Frigoriflavimonas asaccharolytica TaxID=2735899 RepID=A0A8J8K6B4_9FLAO|nr:dynamin family protein [Frigoriflavimonas asaccharolytica]NRS93555.1 hypothetical protein [Frigoriflavimonas asaccharolytica]
MDQHLLQQLQEKRAKMKEFASAALNKNWLSDNDYNSIVEKIDNDILTIGVIGQMKCGKSTFLNSFIFGKEILPAASTPMTAALSVITYGEKEMIEVEFYTVDEWKEIQLQASIELAEVIGDKSLESKIKAAKELVAKSQSINSLMPSLLGSTPEDSLENLKDYVSADGKFVSITKSVTIYSPKEWLKNVKIVDTPGFNDPVVSREERTQDFLKNADVAVLLLYAGRAFDATDREIIFKRIKKVGMGKIIIAINKYDMSYQNGDTISEIINNVKEEISKALIESNDTSMNELLSDIEPIPMSASMALLSKVPMAEIQNNELHTFNWKRFTDIFEISTQAEMLEKSLVADLDNAIESVIEHEKMSILVKKPTSTIMQRGDSKKTDIEIELNKINELVTTLEKPDQNIIDKAKQLKKANRNIEREIDNFNTDLFDQIEEKIVAIKRRIDDSIVGSKKKIKNNIETESVFQKNKIADETNDSIKEAIKKIDYFIEDGKENILKLVRKKSEELSNEVVFLLNEHVDDADDIIKSFILTIKKIRINFDYEMGASPIRQNSRDFFDGGIFFPLNIPKEIIDKFQWKMNLKEEVNIAFESIENNLIEVESQFNKLKDEYCRNFDNKAFSHILSNLIIVLEEVNENIETKASKLNDSKEKQAIILQQESEIKSQIKDMNELKLELGL